MSEEPFGQIDGPMTDPRRSSSLRTKAFVAAQIALVLIAALYAGRALVKIVENREWQWDFTTYYYAAGTAAEGRNPYDTSAVSAATGAHVSVPFVYPPVSLYLFGPLSALEYSSSYYLFLIAKLLALAGLVFLWRRVFPNETGKGSRLIFIITLCLGYGHTILWDMQAGNVSIFEQLFLWLGIYLYTRDKSVFESAFGAVSIVVSSIFKFVPIAFLPLLVLLRRSTANVVACVAAALLFAALHLWTRLSDPLLFRHFLDDARVRDEIGTHNPSSLAFFKSAVRWFGAPEAGAYLLYGLFVTGVLLCSTMIVRRIRRNVFRAKEEQQTALIALCVIAYTLVVPRMKDYSYIVMLMPTLFVIRVAFQRLESRAILYALLWIPFGWYHPFLLAFGMLLSMAAWVWRGEKENARNAAPSVDSIPEVGLLRDRPS